MGTTTLFKTWTDSELAAFHSFFGHYRDYFSRYTSHSDEHRIVYNIFLEFQAEQKERAQKPDNGHSY